MPNKHGHGGARTGAGRPRKYDFWTMVEIGQACETRWRKESDLAVEKRFSNLPHADEIKALWDSSALIPVEQRKEWSASEAYEDHTGDLEAWLHKRGGTSFDETTGAFEGDAPRGVTISKKPPRGTRKRIICTVAAKWGLTESAVDNLWQAYRRFECELRDSAET